MRLGSREIGVSEVSKFFCVVPSIYLLEVSLSKNTTAIGASFSVNEPGLRRPIKSFDDFEFDSIKALAAGRSFTQLDVTASELSTIIAAIASAGASGSTTPAFLVQALELICSVESDYPIMPRYYAVNPSDSGRAVYVGVAQVSAGYWADSHAYLTRKSRDAGLLQQDRRRATIYQQLVYTLVYMMRYRNKITAPLSPEGLYVVHNQGYRVDLRRPSALLANQSAKAKQTFERARRQLV